MNKKKIMGICLIGVLITVAIFVAADGTVKTSSGDVKIFGQGQATYGVGVSYNSTMLSAPFPVIQSLGKQILHVRSNLADTWFQFEISPSGTGTQAAYSMWGADKASGVSGWGRVQHNNNSMILDTGGIGGASGGHIILEPESGRVYIGSSGVASTSKDLYAKAVFTDNGTCGEWDVAGDANYDTDLLDSITANNGVWDLSKLVKKDATGQVVQSVLKTELVPETVEVFNETTMGPMRVPTGRMVNSMWVDMGQLDGYIIGVLKAQQKVIENLTASIEVLESKCS
ncbi:MAG: hypothetical protein V1921_01585 [Candidatus Altiarchaeota archaeon]